MLKVRAGCLDHKYMLTELSYANCGAPRRANYNAWGVYSSLEARRTVSHFQLAGITAAK